ncbi:MAG: tRNA (guanosine(37)-N1)-methyltransferase TrmD [Clostridia bacterium]|nr:tRNA (guanosine(37)-N1)-methyltransferase TrmD [Clostridia bacterium]
MRIDILSIFPDKIKDFLEFSILERALNKNLFEIYYHDIRDYTEDKHCRVDDTPYGGGGGMILSADPIYNAYLSITENFDEKPYVIFLNPSGNLYNQEKCKSLSKKKNLMLICGRYEGFDQRIIDFIGDEEISIGDYVITGGEIAACVIADSVIRLLPGVLSSENSYVNESHFSILLEHPQYTKPSTWQNIDVPEVLLSGDHKKVDLWKKEQSIERTKNRRPDLYDKYVQKANQNKTEY